MIRAKKIRILTAIYFPIAIFIFPCLFIFIPQMFSHLTQCSYFFLFITLVYFLFPPFSNCMGRDNIKPPMNIFLWGGAVIFSQIFLVGLFFIQYNLFVHLIGQDQYLSVLTAHDLPHVFKETFINKAFYPWSLIAVISLVFSCASDHKNPFWAFSETLPVVRNAFMRREIKLITSLYIRLAMQFFIIGNIISFILLTCSQLTIFPFPLQALDGFFITMLLMFNVLSARFRKNLKDAEEKHQPLVFQLLRILFIVGLTGLFVHLGLGLLFSQQFHIDLQMPFISIFTVKNPMLFWKLWAWSWWLLVVPFYCSWLVAISRGRKVRTFLLGVLFFPVSFSLVCFFKGEFGFWNSLNLFGQNTWLWACLIEFGLFSFLFYFAAKRYDQFGFIPAKMPTKQHPVSLYQYWLLSISLLGILLIFGTIGFYLLSTAVFMPLLILFILLPISCIRCIKSQ